MIDDNGSVTWILTFKKIKNKSGDQLKKPRAHVSDFPESVDEKNVIFCGAKVMFRQAPNINLQKRMLIV